MKKWDKKWINTELEPKQGGQGRIFFVNSLSDEGNIYVLKELINNKRSDRFIKEVDLIKKLPIHSNVINILDSKISEDEKIYYYVMPKAELNLQEYISSKSLSIDEICTLFIGILAGVEHIHNHGIIHRDIKPENILLINDTPYISDFGLSINLEEEKRQTPSWEVVGPRYYMAPEFEDGRNGSLTFQSDIYSLGKVLYFMLSSGEIFNREKYNDKNYKLENKYTDKRYSYFNDIFRRSITQSVRERYKNIIDFRNDFREVYRKYRNHPLSLVEEKVSLFELLERPSISKQYTFSKEEKIEIIIYISKWEQKIDCETLLFLLNGTEGVNSYLVEKIFFDSIIEYTKKEKINFLNEICKSEKLVRSIFGGFVNDNFIHNLISPVVENISPQAASSIVQIIFLQLRHMPEIVKKLTTFYASFELESKILFLTAYGDCRIQDSDSLARMVFNSYNKELDNTEGNLLEAILLCCFIYFSPEEIEEKILPIINDMDEITRGLVGRSIVRAFNKKDSGIRRFDLNKITDPVLRIIIETLERIEVTENGV